jgi:hypothetical protein
MSFLAARGPMQQDGRLPRPLRNGEAVELGASSVTATCSSSLTKYASIRAYKNPSLYTRISERPQYKGTCQGRTRLQMPLSRRGAPPTLHDRLRPQESFAPSDLVVTMVVVMYHLTPPGAAHAAAPERNPGFLLVPFSPRRQEERAKGKDGKKGAT